MNMREVVIVSGARTAIGDFEGALKNVSALELGKTVIRESIERAHIADSAVNEVIMGNVLPGGLGQNPARQAMLMAGLPVDAGALTVNKVCGSGLKSVMVAAQAIIADDADIVVAGGMENMYLAPYYLSKARSGYRLWDNKIVDGMVHDGLWDIVADYHMGITADNVAKRFNVSREDQDRYAMGSYEKSKKAAAEGRFKNEIVGVEVPQRKGPPVLFESDEGYQRETSLEKLAKIPPAFQKDGSATAGNSSKLSIGAAAVVVMGRDTAEKLGVKPLAKIIAQGAAGIDTDIVVAAPIKSIPKVLKKAGMSLADIDLHEVNEAFASSTVATIRELGIDEATVNVKGGAVSQGHPIGAKYGMVSLCLGGGEAVSMIVERT
jgi:acetyl-CoA C-acetyltransferase